MSLSCLSLSLRLEKPDSFTTGNREDFGLLSSGWHLLGNQSPGSVSSRWLRSSWSHRPQEPGKAATLRQTLPASDGEGVIQQVRASRHATY